MYIKVKDIKTKVNHELKADFIRAFRDGDVETMRRIAGPYLRSITYPKPELHIPSEVEIEFWKARSEYFVKEGREQRINEKIFYV